MAIQHAIFAMELCLPIVPGASTLGQFAHLVRSQPYQTSAEDKWRFYETLRHMLVAELPRARSGCWDFFDDDTRARNDFDMWSNGMITREGARTSPSGRPQGDPFRDAAQPRFMTVTLAWLLVQGMPSTQSLAATCTIQENMLWHRQSFERILSRLGRVQFSAVKGDVAYVIPGDDEWGLTDEDLKHEKFHYLRPIQG